MYKERILLLGMLISVHIRPFSRHILDGGVQVW